MSTSKSYLSKVFKIIGIIFVLIIKTIYMLGVYIILPIGSMIIAFVIAVVAFNIDIHDIMSPAKTTKSRKNFIPKMLK